ncbi:magnesium transporter [Polaribacter glomeratus]|uniref:Magnesium transporter MgtE n=1 Tax=Polaribacter glomeratus TaxID=102 RepID=A0A2S7WVJ1_9FLAO|nr:magnesium transporter [Polaribacter glomeratus]PQJ81322.1 magnesium transporter [Polaribacter glomeratus]TXD64063.1 magnesium transporter [Polaribacter glomeratus]
MKLKTEIIESELRNEYFSKFPKDAAHTLDLFSAEIVLKYLAELKVDNARDIFFQLTPELITELILNMDDALFRELFFKVNTHLAARLLSRLDKNKVTDKLSLLPDLISREILDFLNYKEDTAGYLMETNVITFHSDNLVNDVLTRIRKIGKRNIMVIYVTDEEGKLLGKVPIQLIAISNPTEKLAKLMGAAPFINAMGTREEILEAIEKEDLLQIPVTDINNILLGIIRNDALMSASKQEITENLQSMFGAGKEEQALSKWTFAVRKRLPWLQVNLATAFLASMVVGLFEETIAKITILAIFLPVVAGQSGNTGSQALAVTIRGLALKEIRISQWFRVAKKEIMVGFVNGVAVALTTGTIVYFWTSSLGIAIVIAISMVISMLIAGFAGAIIPIGLKAIGQDPATSSSIILTTVTDICGFLSFLGLASLLSSALGIV